MRSSQSLVSAIAITLAAWSSAAAAQPQERADEAEAKRLFQQAMTLVDAGRWGQACPMFAAAHALFPTGGTAMNAARCAEDAGRKADALVLYNYVLGLPDQPAERTRVAKERAAAIKAEQTRAPTEPAPEPTSTPPNALPPGARSPQDPTIEESGLGYAPSAVAFSVGGAGLVVGAVVGGLALAQMDAVRETCSDNVCPEAQQAEADEAQTKSWAANTAFIVGGVGVAAGIVLAIVAATSEPNTATTGMRLRADGRGIRVEF